MNGIAASSSLAALSAPLISGDLAVSSDGGPSTGLISGDNVDVPQNRRIEFRIGVNLGDIIVEESDIYGDGVNVAARIESIAKPGSVAVSGTVRDHIGNKLDLAFEDRGASSAKTYRGGNCDFDHNDRGSRISKWCVR